ncbi:MAG: M23 family metallopeptidase [Sporomusaceae bacterium]|nr:M23 family metallopeptidase [Sporomusaceae bacterium]
MPNRISQRLWPIEYWQNKKKQLMAGGQGGRRVWLALALTGVAALLVVTAAAGIFTAQPYRQARHIPLAPMPQTLPTPLAAADIAAPAADAQPTQQPVAAPAAVAEVPSLPSHWPASGQISRAFGWQPHPAFKDWRYHNGISISMTAGAPVAAAISGQVTQVRQDPQTGLTVVIAAADWRIYHGSLAAATVKNGDRVAAGEVVGSAGETAFEPYPHVYLAIEKNGVFIDPADILPGR